MRMARVNVTIPDEVIDRAKAAGLNVSRLATAALAEELDRLSRIAALDAYLADLEGQLGPIPPDEQVEAIAWVDRILAGTSETVEGRRRRSA
jgi:Post-segregation antitoxin CcdA